MKPPVVSEMLELLEVQSWDNTGWHWIDNDKKATFMGIWWASDLCGRAGEYTHAAPKDEDHCIRANELTFVLFKPIYVGLWDHWSVAAVARSGRTPRPHHDLRFKLRASLQLRLR